MPKQKAAAPSKKTALEVEYKRIGAQQVGEATGRAPGGARKRKVAEAASENSATPRPKKEGKGGAKRKAEATNKTDGEDFESFAFGR